MTVKINIPLPTPAYPIKHGGRKWAGDKIIIALSSIMQGALPDKFANEPGYFRLHMHFPTPGRQNSNN